MSFKIFLDNDSNIFELWFFGESKPGEHWKAKNLLIEYAQKLNIDDALVNLYNLSTGNSQLSMFLFDFCYSWHNENMPPQFRIAWILPKNKRLKNDIILIFSELQNNSYISGSYFDDVHSARLSLLSKNKTKSFV